MVCAQARREDCNAGFERVAASAYPEKARRKISHHQVHGRPNKNNLPCILVVEKVDRDLLHESVKNQLAYMSQFVNVSKEMYQAINNETIDEKNHVASS